MVYWETNNLLGSEIELLYGQWEARQTEWHDRIELGDRVAEAFLKGGSDGSSSQCSGPSRRQAA